MQNVGQSQEPECRVLLRKGKRYNVQREDPSTMASDFIADIVLSTSMSSSSTATTPPITTVASGVGPPHPPSQRPSQRTKPGMRVVSGDGYWAVANEAVISLDDFYKWSLASGRTAESSPCGLDMDEIPGRDMTALPHRFLSLTCFLTTPGLLKLIPTCAPRIRVKVVGVLTEACLPMKWEGPYIDGTDEL